MIVVTTESQVFSWGEGSKGQLGHGDTNSLAKPRAVEALTGKAITRYKKGVINFMEIHILQTEKHAKSLKAYTGLKGSYSIEKLSYGKKGPHSLRKILHNIRGHRVLD